MMKEKILKAHIISPGIAIGKPFWVDEPSQRVNQTGINNIETEVERFYKQVNHIASELSELFLRISKEIDIKDAEIIQTQQMILADDGFKEKVIKLISEEFIPVEAAVERVMKSFSQRMADSSNEYMRQRANDFIDIAKYFKNQSIKDPGIPDTEIDKETILIVGDLFPSVVLACERLAAKGIVAKSSAPTSHAAILARSFAIPVLVNALDAWDKIGKGDQIIVDAYDGNITLSPGPQTLRRYKKHLQEQKRLNKEYKAIKSIRAKTLDNTRIFLGVNIERLDELHLFSPADIDELGLFRTEFLFMFDQTNFPPFEQQVKWYEKIVKFMNGKPVTFRVLDVGGDKFLPYFSMGKQSNPYLGLRAHRVFQYHPEILETQLRAILRAAKFGPVRILYPMINNLEEIEYLNGILSSVKTKSAKFEIGIMVETPASVFMIRELIQHVDFVSIGTNDLVQYTLTVDRNNENVMPFYQPFHPLILRMLKQVVDAAANYDKPVSLCGEIASDPRWTPLLLGLGFRSLSMAPLLIPPIKKQILSLDIEPCRALAQKTLATNYVSDVEQYINEFSQEKFIK